MDRIWLIHRVFVIHSGYFCIFQIFVCFFKTCSAKKERKRKKKITKICRDFEKIKWNFIENTIIGYRVLVYSGNSNTRDRMRICVYLWSTYSTFRALTELGKHIHTHISSRCSNKQAESYSKYIKDSNEPTKLSYSRKNQVEKSHANQINNWIENIRYPSKKNSETKIKSIQFPFENCIFQINHRIGERNSISFILGRKMLENRSPGSWD